MERAKAQARQLQATGITYWHSKKSSNACRTMGNKNKNNKSSHYPAAGGSVPNAPDLQQVLLASQQPPHNPYYPTQQLAATAGAHYDPILNNNFSPPPPYNTDHYPSALQMSRLNQQQSQGGSIQMSNTGYSRLSGTGQQPPAVIIHQSAAPLHYDRRAERQHRQVTSYNRQVFLLGLVTILLSVFAESLWKKRNYCNGGWQKLTVAKFGQGNTISLQDLREAHFQVVGLGCVILVLSLIKCAIGRSKGYSCYLFLMFLLTLIGTLTTGALAYLSFFAPCTSEDLISRGVKTFVAAFSDTLPAPDQQMLGEMSVFSRAKEDPNGIIIFCINFFNFTLYLSSFISSMVPC